MTKRKKDEFEESGKPENGIPEDLRKKKEEKVQAGSEMAGETEEPGITISYAELEGMQKEIADLQAQSDEYLAGLQRERADFANYKRRIDQENNNTFSNALAVLVKPFLVVIDDLERALKFRPEDMALKPWADGIALVLQKLMQTLESQGIKRIQINPGDAFDPLITEAVTHEENPDFEDGQIIEVLQAGYKIKDRIIRPALVRVAK